MSDLDEYETLVHEHNQMLYAYVRSLVRNADVAEDVCQETFTRSFHKLHTLKNKKRPAAWLRAIARNLAFAQYKKNNREISTDPQTLQGMDEVFVALDRNRDSNNWENRAQVVRSCLRELPTPLKTCCELHYFQGLRAKIIAERLNASLALILKRLQRARETIARCVSKKLNLEGGSR